MRYNVKVTYYNNELQISRYGYKIYRVDEEMKVNDVDNQTSNNYGKQSFVNRKKSDEDSDKDNKVRSERRSKQSIYEIARANDWDYFATFTMRDNRYDYDSCKDRLRKFLNNFKCRKVSDLEYLVVPEQHMDGAWHFHALLKGNIDAYLSETWHKGRYEIIGYNLGKCELENVKDTNRVASYITKYITKDLANTVKNKRRYFYSKGLKKGESVEMLIDRDISTIDFVIGNFPNYDMTHVRTTEYNGNRIEYIQLKRTDFDDKQDS